MYDGRSVSSEGRIDFSMKIVITPDKFKGSLTGFEFCDAVEEGFLNVFPQSTMVKKPLADGGDGTIEVVKHYLEGEKIDVIAKDPLFRPRKTSFVYSPTTSTAFIEMAEISGLKLLDEEERNCMFTSSVGTGELIVDAIKRGAQAIILGIGGSATNDGGMGMAHALGFRFLNVEGEELKPTGENLIEVHKIDASNTLPELQRIVFKVACDVTNPLFGKNGAAYVYAAQKGASLVEIELLDKGLENYAKVIREHYGVAMQQIKGAGAAGGMGAGALVFLNAQLTSGIELIKEIANFDQAIADADWIITGEGKLDGQTFSGKTISGVLAAAKEKNIPVAALCGAVEMSDMAITKLGLHYVDAISKECKNLEEAKVQAYSNLVKAAQQFALQLKR
jgi:glycerate kinase